MTIKPTPTNSVGRLVSSRPWIQLANSCQAVSPVCVVPVIFFNWPITTSMPIPKMKPVSTLSERKLEIQPIFNANSTI